MNSNYHISAEDGPHNPVTGVPVPVTTSAQRIKQLETQLAEVQADIDKINKLLLFAVGDRNIGYFGSGEEVEKSRQHQAEMNAVLDAYVSKLKANTSPRAALDRDIDASQVARVKFGEWTPGNREQADDDSEYSGSSVDASKIWNEAAP